MSISSDQRFRVLHGLRIKGFVKLHHLVDLVCLPEPHVNEHLGALQSDGHSQFREKGGLWQLTPSGRQLHGEGLEADASQPGFREGLAERYPTFLELNEAFKALCGDWQLRDGAPNDHGDPAYDREVISRLVTLNDQAGRVTDHFGGVAERFDGYSGRLERTAQAVVAGEQQMFTGVMCGSYHDVWMELHEDLLLTQSIDRAAEGSF